VDYQEKLREIDELKKKLDLLRLQIELLQVAESQPCTSWGGFTQRIEFWTDHLVEERSRVVDDFRKMQMMAGA
jgi:hypothetical protein